MKRSWWIGWSLFLAALVASVVVIICGVREPEYQGRSLNVWARDLRSGSPQARTNASLAIRQMGAKAVPFLVAELQARDSKLKIMVADFLEGRPEGQFHLRRDFERRSDAFQALQTLGPDGREAIPALAKMLDDPAESQMAAYTLYRAGPSAVPVLERALTNRAGKVRSAAISMLGLAGDPKSAPALVGRLQDADAMVRCQAAIALRRFPEQAATVVPALSDCLEDADEAVRENAADSLGEFGPGGRVAIPKLLGLVTNAIPTPGPGAMRALMKLDPEGTLAALTNNLAGGNPAVRRASARALMAVQTGGGPAVPALVKGLKDADACVRRDAAVALREIGEEPGTVVPALMANLNDPDPEVRSVTAIALGAFGPRAKAAAPTLVKLLGENKDNRVTALGLFNALYQIDPETAEKLNQE